MITILIIGILAILACLFFLFPLLHLLGWFLIGLIAGFIAQFFIKDAPKLAIWQTLLIGIGGSLVGGSLSQLLGVDFGILGSIGTALLLLWLWVLGHRNE